MRLFFMSFLLIFCAPYTALAVGVPGPKDNLYAAIHPVFQNVKSLAASCDPDGGLKVDLLSEQTLPGYSAGQVFGATACGLLAYNYSELRKVFDAKGSVQKALSRVKTFGSMKLIQEADHASYIEFEILVPITENYIVKSWVHFEATDEMAALQWYQDDKDSKLENNRGFLVLVPHGENTKFYLHSYHILKKEHRLRFPMSTFAPGFTRNHYGNYFRAVKSYAQELIP